MPPRGRNANTSLLAVLGGGDDFSDDEFQATDNLSHMLTPLSRNVQKPPPRSRAAATAATKKMALDAPAQPTSAPAPTAKTNTNPAATETAAPARSSRSKNTASSTAPVPKQTQPSARPSRRAAAQAKQKQMRELDDEEDGMDGAAEDSGENFARHDSDDDNDQASRQADENTRSRMDSSQAGAPQTRTTRARKRAASASVPAGPATSTRQTRGRAAKAAKVAATATAPAPDEEAESPHPASPVADELDDVVDDLGDRDEGENGMGRSQAQFQIAPSTTRTDSASTKLLPSHHEPSSVRPTSRVYQPQPPLSSSITSASPGLSRWRSLQRPGSLTEQADRIVSQPAPPSAPDVRIRQQLSEANRKIEQLEARYTSLSELATKEARTNFENLQKAAEQQAKVQEQLIESLRQEVAFFRARTAQTTEMEDRVAELEEENEGLVKELEKVESRGAEFRAESEQTRAELERSQAECERLSQEANSLRTSFQMLDKDNKMLSSKLAAATKAAAAATALANSHGVDTGGGAGAGGPPGGGINGGVSGAHRLGGHRPIPSAAKGAGPGRGGIPPEEAHALKMEKLKMELYCDLTNLLIHAIKTDVVDGENSHVYDCSQTGTNGTLRFSLSIPISSAPIHQTEITYTPVIDPKNDRRLLEVLPEYLQDEIVFRRDSLSKLHKRILDSLEIQPEPEPESDSGAESP